MFDQTPISHQDISTDALEDAASPKSKEADEGAKVGRMDVLHVRHRHLLPRQPVDVSDVVTPLAQLVATVGANPNNSYCC